MGTKHAGILEPSLRTPPLGGTVCPDPAWQAGRTLILQGPMAFLGAHWVLTASVTGQPASTVAPPLPLPPGVPEGSIPYSDVLSTGTIVAVPPPDEEGFTAFADVPDGTAR